MLPVARLTVKLRGHPEAPTKPLAAHGPLQRLLGSNRRLLASVSKAPREDQNKQH